MQKDSYRMRLEWKQRIIGHYYELEEDRETEPRERERPDNNNRRGNND